MCSRFVGYVTTGVRHRSTPHRIPRRAARRARPETYQRRCADMAEIPKTMNAVVMHAPEDYRLEEIDVPAPAADELLIRVEAVGVCASDLKCYDGAAKFWGDENRERWVQPGITPGHELVGEIVSGSPEALAGHGVEVGDRIACEQIVPCGDCLYCQRGWYRSEERRVGKECRGGGRPDV